MQVTLLEYTEMNTQRLKKQLFSIPWWGFPFWGFGLIDMIGLGDYQGKGPNETNVLFIIIPTGLYILFLVIKYKTEKPEDPNRRRKWGGR